MKQVDVLMPVYNDATTLGAALDSVLVMDYSGDYSYNLVVLPNGCTDGSAKLAQERIPEFDGHEYVQLDIKELDDPSKIQALNLGLSATSSEAVVCVDGDATFSYNCFDQVVGTLLLPGVVVSGAVPNFYVAEEAQDTFLGDIQQVAEIVCASQPVHTQPFGGTMAFRREAVSQFPEDAGVDDTWLGLHAAHCYGTGSVEIAQKATFSTEFPTTWSDWIMQQTRWARNNMMVADRFPEFAHVIRERRRAQMRMSGEIDQRALRTMQKANIPADRLREYHTMVRMWTENATMVPDVVHASGTWVRQSR